MDAKNRTSFQLISPPYDRFEEVRHLTSISAGAGRNGAVLIWALDGEFTQDVSAVAARPRGLALISILPPAPSFTELPNLYLHIEHCRPCAVLPYHRPVIHDIRKLLLRGPDDIAEEVTDYLTWRKPGFDTEARMLIRRTLQLSESVRSVTHLARALYISRRALGRRFSLLHLPVPSHVLHFGRILRAYVRAQRDELPIAPVATALGYPDGFALSNQMKRLVGVRPSEARERLGWEWLIESWLTHEALLGQAERDLSRVRRSAPASQSTEEPRRRKSKGATTREKKC